jgi:hypothetical protein
MPERAYADIMGSFRRGAGRQRAGAGDYEGAMRADPDNAETYAGLADRQRQSRDREMQQGAQRTYAQALASGNYEDAATVAGKMGDAEGVTGARAAGTAAGSEQRMARVRTAIGYVSALEQIDSMPEAQRQTAYQQWLAQAQSGADEQGRAYLQTLPPNYAPNVTGGVRSRIEYAMAQELGPEEWVRLSREQRQQEGGERRYTSASGGILDTYTGEVQPNPHYVRGGRQRQDEDEAETAARELGVTWDRPGDD